MHDSRAVMGWVERMFANAEIASQADPLSTTVRHCGDPSAEYSAMTGSAALLVAPAWAPILVEGADAADYLHRRLSQAIHPLAVGRGAHALQLDGDGRLQADLLVYRGHDALMLLVERPFAEQTFELIEKYTLMDDVQLTRLWESELTMGLAGPQAPQLIAALIDPRPDPPHLLDDRWCAFFTVTLAGLPCRVFADGRFAVTLYHLCVPTMAIEQMLNCLMDACAQEGGCTAGQLAFDLLRVESGVTRHGLDTTSRTIPLEAGLTDAIDHDKGCYPGQEVIARITNLGHPARALVLLSLEGEHALEPRSPLRADGREVGQVTSAVTWPALGRTEALGYLNWNQRDIKQVEVAADDQAPLARVRSVAAAHAIGGHSGGAPQGGERND